MEITNDLIQRFFENKCEPEEVEAVIRHLQLHPEQAAQFLGIDEWNAIDPGQPVPDHSQEEVLEQLRKRLFRRSATSTSSTASTAFIRRLSWTSVAASLLLAVGGWTWLTTRNSHTKALTAASGQQTEGRQADSHQHPAASWIVRNNPTGQAQKLLLPDGSRVKLYAHSSLRYTDSFGITRRDSWLEGEAEFSVQKDQVHPFTVLSGSLATTALGTSFDVKALPAAANITVKLFTGKVVVRSLRPRSGWNKDIYLLPGEELLYDDHRMLATIGRFTPLPQNQTGNGMPMVQEGDLVFNNSSLKEVFRQLSIQYHKKFTYRTSDLTGMNFTGTVPRTDSLDSFLRLLATMNNLDIQQQAAGIIVTRHRE